MTHGLPQGGEKRRERAPLAVVGQQHSGCPSHVLPLFLPIKTGGRTKKKGHKRVENENRREQRRGPKKRKKKRERQKNSRKGRKQRKRESKKKQRKRKGKKIRREKEKKRKTEQNVENGRKQALIVF